jgi:hypothetical protein
MIFRSFINKLKAFIYIIMTVYYIILSTKFIGSIHFTSIFFKLILGIFFLTIFIKIINYIIIASLIDSLLLIIASSVLDS